MLENQPPFCSTIVCNVSSNRGPRKVLNEIGKATEAEWVKNRRIYKNITVGFVAEWVKSRRIYKNIMVGFVRLGH